MKAHVKTEDCLVLRDWVPEWLWWFLKVSALWEIWPFEQLFFQSGAL
jgi:hypothetical protein